jgi:hypothetical protein
MVDDPDDIHDPPLPAAPGAKPSPALDDALALASEQDGALTRAQARSSGVSAAVYFRLRRDAWSSPVRGSVVIPSERHPFSARVRAACLSSTDTTVCGVTAARILGLPGIPAWREDEPTHLLVPRRTGRRQRRGMVLHFSDVDPSDVFDLAGMPVTGVQRTIIDLVLWSDRDTAVSILDAALHEQLLGADDLTAIGARLARRRGGRACRSRLALADGRSESPLETRLRLLLHDAGLSPETLQFVIRGDAGYPIARLDLAWPSRLLDVEADGIAPHSGPEALFRDRERQNALIGRGWTVLRFTWTDVMRRPDYVVACVTRHLHRAQVA